jgi:uncharacterized membrane protein
MSLIQFWYVIVIIIIIVILFQLEQRDHDCIDGKKCRNSSPPPLDSDSDLVFIDKIREMVRANYNYITWRQCLMLGLIAAFPIIYYLKQRSYGKNQSSFPTLFEWIVVACLIFVASYFSQSWIWVHFYYPSSRQIEKNLDILRDRLNDQLKKTPPPQNIDSPPHPSILLDRQIHDILNLDF